MSEDPSHFGHPYIPGDGHDGEHAGSARVDERYRATELVWGAGPNRFLVEEVTGLKPGTALDVACGEGRNAIWLAQNGWQVVGVDFSAVGLDKARPLAAESGVTVAWAQGDLTTWQPPNTYDLVVVMYLHLPGDIRHSVLRGWQNQWHRVGPCSWWVMTC